MATFTTNKELDEFKIKHQKKIEELEKKINFDDVREYELLKNEKLTLSRAYNIGDWIKWSESEDDGCGGTCARFFTGEIKSINFNSHKYEVKDDGPKNLFCSFSQAIKIKPPVKQEAALSELKKEMKIRRPFGGF